MINIFEFLTLFVVVSVFGSFGIRALERPAGGTGAKATGPSNTAPMIGLPSNHAFVRCLVG